MFYNYFKNNITNKLIDEMQKYILQGDYVRAEAFAGDIIKKLPEKKQMIDNILLNEKENLTKEIIDYLYQDEKKHFEELEQPKNHIFSKIERLKTLIE